MSMNLMYEWVSPDGPVALKDILIILTITSGITTSLMKIFKGEMLIRIPPTTPFEIFC